MAQLNNQKNRRSSQEWLSQVRGDQGTGVQRAAHEDLAKYLYIVAYNYLKDRQAKARPEILGSFSDLDLAELAREFVQDTLARLVDQNYALLQQFKEMGRFTSWMAVIIRNMIAQELRRSYWTRRQEAPKMQNTEEDIEDWLSSWESPDVDPETAVIQRQIINTLKSCFEKLAEAQRVAFGGLIHQKRNVDDLAKVIGRTTNAVYILVHRAKRNLRKCLRKTAWTDEEILEIF
jgi:RNA polymerase sigma-70 factor (ECF subfamily)